MAATAGTDLAELGKRDPELASAVGFMVKRKEKDERELETGSKSRLKKQVVCVYKSVFFVPFFQIAAAYQ